MSTVSSLRTKKATGALPTIPEGETGREPAEPLAGQVGAFGLAEPVEGHAVPPLSSVPACGHPGASSIDNTRWPEIHAPAVFGPASAQFVEPARRGGERVGGALRIE